MKSFFRTALVAFLTVGASSAQVSYTDPSATGAWNTARWNNTADASPYDANFTAGNNVAFTSGTYNIAGMGAAINVGDITVNSGVTVNFTAASSTFATGGAVRTITVGSGGLLDFSSQAFSTAAGTGFIKSGSGVLALTGASYTGGFTLNDGTVIARGVNAMGNGASNTLTLNGGTVASNATRDFSGRFGGGITVNGDVQFGEFVSNVALANDTANLTFSNNVNLGGDTRTFTLGNRGNMTFSGVISNGSLIFAANPGAEASVSGNGRFDITNTANTFTGDIVINGPEVRFTANGSLGDAANNIIIDGGRLSIVSGGTVTISASRNIYVGEAAGTSISAPGATAVLTYNGVIADITGQTGAWAKQGAGTLVLGGVSTYTGATAINNGTLRLSGGDDRLPTSTVVSMGQAGSSNLGTLNLDGRNQTIAGLQSVTGTNTSANKNTVTSAAPATLTLNIADAETYLFGNGTTQNSGVITGFVEVVKTGLGTQILGDASNYSGGTRIQQGTLVVSHDSALGVGTVTLEGPDEATLLIEKGFILSNVIVFSSTNAATSIIREIAEDAAFDVGTTQTLSSDFGSPEKATTATFMAGTATADRTLTLAFVESVSAVNDAIRLSDIFSLNGTGGDIFALQLSLDSLPLDAFLAWLDTNTNTWVNAVDGNTGSPGSLAGFYESSFYDFLADFNSSIFDPVEMLGAWGFHSSTNSVWAVLDHNSEFAVIPEPSTYALLALGLAALWFLRRCKTKARA